MTRPALAAEEGLACPGVADDDAGRLEPRLVIAGGTEGMDERRDIGNLIVGEHEFRHAGAAAAHHRRDELAVLIVEHRARSEQAWTDVAAARVGAVAELAV